MDDHERLRDPDVVGIRAEAHVPGFGRQSLDEIGGEILAVPVGEQNLVDDLLVFVGDGDGVRGAFRRNEGVGSGLDDGAVKLGIDQRVPSEPGVGPADDQFIVKDGDGYFFSNVFKGKTASSFSLEVNSCSFPLI